MSDIYLLDTNVLVYAHDKYSPYNELARSLRDNALTAKIQCCICPQILLEFFAVITDKKRINNPVEPMDAIKEVELYLRSPVILKIYPPEDIFRIISSLLERFPVKAQGIFDLYLVATMLANDIKGVYTYDDSIFKMFGEIEVLKP